MIKEARAPIPSSRNTGTLLVKDFGEADRRATPTRYGKRDQSLAGKNRGGKSDAAATEGFCAQEFPKGFVLRKRNYKLLFPAASLRLIKSCSISPRKRAATQSKFSRAVWAPLNFFGTC